MQAPGDGNIGREFNGDLDWALLEEGFARYIMWSVIGVWEGMEIEVGWLS